MPSLSRVVNRTAALCAGLLLVACAVLKSPLGESTRIPSGPVGEPVQATPEAVEEAGVRMARNAAAQRRAWAGRSFEEFEASVYKEPFAGGKYIVSGDTPIASRKQLREFFETRIQRDPSEVVKGGLIVHQVGGQDAVWSALQKKQLTYCVSSAFGTRHAAVVSDMQAATQAWEQAADVDFIHVASQDAGCTASNQNVVFDVRPVNVNGDYLARAFFPDEPRASRNVLIDETSFQLDPNGTLKLVGILRHELGHTLGWRHEHTRPESGTCFEDADWRPLTSYDRFSVMHYPQCNGGGDWSLALTSRDQNGAACAYGPAAGFQVDPAVCAAPTPTPPPSACAPSTQIFGSQQVTQGQERPYGPFAVSAGTSFEAKMSGVGSAAGDPDLYVRFGAAPQRSAGGYACRPYLDGADEACTLAVPAGQSKAFVMVHGFASGSYDLSVTHTSASP
jgi:hypothetical protein